MVGGGRFRDQFGDGVVLVRVLVVGCGRFRDQNGDWDSQGGGESSPCRGGTGFGKLGGMSWDQDISGVVENYKNDGFDFGIGAGVAVGLGPLSIRGEYEYFDAGRGDMSMLSVGVTYLFD